MPIYAYRCSACGHAKDVLQKIADPVLSTCPACGAEAFTKQVTAAGFQLKGSGWYVTDFRGGSSGGKAAETGGSSGAAAPAGGAATSEGGSSGSGAGSGATSGSSEAGGSGGSTTSAAGGCGTSCACH